MDDADGCAVAAGVRAGAVGGDETAAPDVSAETVHGLMVGLLASLRALLRLGVGLALWAVTKPPRRM